MIRNPFITKRKTMTRNALLITATLIAAPLLGLAATSAQAALITQDGDNSASEDWNTAVDWSNNLAPIAANDYITASGLLLRGGPSTSGAASTFGGGSLEVVSNSRLLMKNINTTSTINGNLTISGGTVDLGPNAASPTPIARNGTLKVNNLIISGTGSQLGVSPQGGVFTIDGTLTGSGDLTMFSVSDFGGTISITGISGYTGAINLTSNTNGLVVAFGTDYTFSNTFTIGTDSVLSVTSGRTLTFNEGDLVDTVNGPVAAGTYTASSLGVNYTGSGTIIVVPEPASLVLLGLGGLLIASRKRKTSHV